MTTFAAIHDLNIAALYCDRILVMKDGFLVKEGTPEEIFDPAFIFAIFGVHVSIDCNTATQKPQISYIPNYIHDSGKSDHEHSMSHQYCKILEN